MHKTPEVLHKSMESPLRLIGCGAHAAPQGRDFPPHQHAVWELVYYREGNILCPIGDDVFEARPGTLLITPPHTVHAEIARTAYANFFLTVNADDTDSWGRICFDDADRTCGHLCAALVREWSGQAKGRDAMLALLLAQLALVIQRMQEHRQLTDAERIVCQTEQLLEERFATSLTINEVAREVGASPSTLRAHFVRYRGISPLDHLHVVRRRHALALIQNSTLTLEAISNLCGYDSASHLSRHIKRAAGRSPGSFRVGRSEEVV